MDDTGFIGLICIHKFYGVLVSSCTCSHRIIYNVWLVKIYNINDPENCIKRGGSLPLAWIFVKIKMKIKTYFHL